MSTPAGVERPCVIRGGLLLEAGAHRCRPADILVQGGRIAAIGAPGLAVPGEAAVIDARDRLMMPGMVNAHTHGHGSIGKGAGDRWTLELLLNAGPWLSGARSAEHKYLAALVGALEMLRKGCTACYDLYFEYPLPSREGMAAVARGYLEAGVRAVVAPMIADRTFFEAIPGLMDVLPAALRREVEGLRLAPREGTIEACRELLAGWAIDRERVRLALAPTIPLHCTDGFLIDCARLAREHGAGLHTHLAESKVQVVAGMRRYGTSLAAHLEDLGLLGPDLTGAHCVWLSPDDIARLAHHGVSVAHNPGSNLRLGSGIAAVGELLGAGINVGIGTDGAHCSDNQNMFEATRLASFVSRVRSHDPQRWLSTEQSLEMATTGSARALGFGDRIGRIAEGAWADIVFLDLSDLNYWPLNDPTNQIVHTEEGAAVDGVMVGGEVALWNGRFTRIDMPALRARVEAAARHLREANQGRRALAERLEGLVTRYCVGLAREPCEVRAMASAGEAPGHDQAPRG